MGCTCVYWACSVTVEAVSSSCSDQEVECVAMAAAREWCDALPMQWAECLSMGIQTGIHGCTGMETSRLLREERPARGDFGWLIEVSKPTEGAQRVAEMDTMYWAGITGGY